jgi:hypothetical protein
MPIRARILAGGLQLDEDTARGRVTLRSKHRHYVFGAFLLVFAGGLIALFVRAGEDEVTQVLGLAMGLAFLAMALYYTLPRRVTTDFDTEKHICRHELSICGWKRRHSYEFGEISGIGMCEFGGGDGFTYMPTLFLLNGQRRAMSTANGSALDFQPTLARVCRLTGLSRRDAAG